MPIKRMLASSIVALLLSATSIAAACDLSCAFASMSSDCHSEQAEIKTSASDGMNMDGMAMPGMAIGEDQQAVSEHSQANAAHPSIGEMGPCEKQACSNGSGISPVTSRSVDSHFHSILAVTETPRADSAAAFHDARDALATYRVLDGIPLQLSLRI